MERNQIKLLIELSSTVEEADKVLSEKACLKSLSEKLAFLRGMFDEIEIVGRDNTETDELRYMLWLHSIIEGKLI